MIAWHGIEADQAVTELGVDPESGLTQRQASDRSSQFGINDIGRESGRGPVRLLLSQFADFMIIVLVAAAVVSGIVGEVVDTIAILVIVVLNAAFGAVQEYRAQRAVEALRQLAPLTARVLRDGLRGVGPR